MPKRKKQTPAAKKPKVKKAERPVSVQPQKPKQSAAVVCVKDCPYRGKPKNCKHKTPKGCKWANRGELQREQGAKKN